MNDLNRIEMAEDATTVLGCINTLKKEKLTKEEEFALATEMKNDSSLTWEFCSHYILWAVKLSKWLYSSVRYDPAYSLDDIIIMSICELHAAAARYQPSRARFTTCSFSYILNNVRAQLYLKKNSRPNLRRPETMIAFEPFSRVEESYDLHQTYGLEDKSLADSEIVSEFSQFGEEASKYLRLWILHDISISEIARMFHVNRYRVDKIIKEAAAQLKDKYTETCAA